MGNTSKKALCFIASFIYALIVIGTSLALSGSQRLDIILNYAAKSFGSLSEISPISSAGDGVYLIHSPGGTEHFSFGSDIYLMFDAAPFIAAGFDPDRLSAESIYVTDGYIVFASQSVHGVDSPSDDALVVFEEILRNNRSHIHYSMEQDSYELHMGEHSFRWARDWQSNSMGMSFLLDPKVFIDTGLNPKTLDGWTSENMEMSHGSDAPAERLMRSYSFVVQ